MADGTGVESEHESELRAIPQSEPSLDGGGPPSFESPGSIPSEPELPVRLADGMINIIRIIIII